MQIIFLIFHFVQIEAFHVNSPEFSLHIVHMNDFHARFAETNTKGNDCKKGDDNCIGGFSRNYRQIQDIVKNDPDTVVLNAGDNFQGSIWYTLFKWNVTQYFLNKIPFTALTLGNHEFDDNIQGLIPYLQHLKYPVVISNLDDSDVPQVHRLYQKSIIIERNNKKIGIIGVTTTRTPKTSSPGKLKFFNESESVYKEAERLVTEHDVFTNIVVSHSGYEVEKQIAAKATTAGRITLIVGGHSHTFLYSGDSPLGPEKSQGPYPTVVHRQDGDKVLVTQASSYARYLGNFFVNYAANGSIKSWTGEPIYLSHDKPTDPAIDKEINRWMALVDETANQILGSITTELSANQCRQKECSFGNFVTDAMVHAYTKRRDTNKNEWTYAAIAIANGGSFRSDIPAGNVTFRDLATAQPFLNTLDVSDIQGGDLLKLFEFCAEPYVDKSNKQRVNWLQVSGLKVVFKESPDGNKVSSIKVRCQKCAKPQYDDLDVNATYRIITPSFLTRGGDTFTMLKDYLTNTEKGPEDLTAMREYLQDKSPVNVKIEGRLTFE